MNFLKKKLKPLTSGLTNATSNSHHHSKHDKTEKDLEDDLYDEYVVEAPPHPSELIALGVDPNLIDVNDPEKLKELYRKAKEEGKDKKTNSVLLARQRQKEEIEEKKKTREEWLNFDSLTARVDQAVKNSQKTLEQLKESSAVYKLTEPEYELKLSADQIFKSSAAVKQEKSANSWIDFTEEEQPKKKDEVIGLEEEATIAAELDEFGCRKKKVSLNSSAPVASHHHIVNELLEDFGIDLRTTDQKEASKQVVEKESIESSKDSEPSKKLDIDFKSAARPRPRPNAAKQEPDPFDTSFISAPEETAFLASPEEKVKEPQVSARALDPFDTSYVNF